MSAAKIDDKRLEEPFSDGELEIIRRHQNDRRYHPLTCANGHGALIPERAGLRCETCGYVQRYVMSSLFRLHSYLPRPAALPAVAALAEPTPGREEVREAVERIYSVHYLGHSIENIYGPAGNRKHYLDIGKIKSFFASPAPATDEPLTFEEVTEEYLSTAMRFDLAGRLYQDATGWLKYDMSAQVFLLGNRVFDGTFETTDEYEAFTAMLAKLVLRTDAKGGA